MAKKDDDLQHGIKVYLVVVGAVIMLNVCAARVSRQGGNV